MASWLDAAAAEMDPDKPRGRQYANGGFVAAPEQELARQFALCQAQHEFLDGCLEEFTAQLLAKNRRVSVRLRRAYRALRGRP